MLSVKNRLLADLSKGSDCSKNAVVHQLIDSLSHPLPGYLADPGEARGYSTNSFVIY